MCPASGGSLWILLGPLFHGALRDAQLSVERSGQKADTGRGHAPGTTQALWDQASGSRVRGQSRPPRSTVGVPRLLRHQHARHRRACVKGLAQAQAGARGPSPPPPTPPPCARAQKVAGAARGQVQDEAGLPPRPRPSRLPAAQAAPLSEASGLAPSPPLSCRPRAGHDRVSRSPALLLCVGRRRARGPRARRPLQATGRQEGRGSAPTAAGADPQRGCPRTSSVGPLQAPRRGPGRAAGPRAGGGWRGESGTQQGEWPGPGVGKERARELREGKGPGLVGRDGGLPGPSVRGRVELLLPPGARVPEYRSRARLRSGLCARAST